MAYISLGPSQLRIPTDYGQTDWLSTYNYNWSRLNSFLLRLSNLLDTNTSGLANGDVLRYNSSSTRWEPYTPPYPPQSTTTTTTTTTTV